MGLTKYYDVIIIGGGIGGLLCAYRLNEACPEKRVLLLEQGKPLKKRSCPILAGKTDRCIQCESCSIMKGMAGAGAFSDGKYNITTEYGGWLTEFVDEDTVMNYILEADAILQKYGAGEDCYLPDDELKLLCLQHDLHMQQGKVKHLGTDANFSTMVKLIRAVEKHTEVITEAVVTDVDKEKHAVIFRKKNTVETVSGGTIVFAVGRSGSRMFEAWCDRNDICRINNQVDLGVRVELPYEIWKAFSGRIYEPKIQVRSRRYGDIVRMFCFNERGQVVTENTDGVITVNGHAYKEESRKSKNSNFAMLVSTRFTEPFNKPVEYARSVAALANQISGGGVIVQRLGDLERGRRSTEGRIKAGYVRPTLNAVPGDLSLCIPKRQLDDIVEALHLLDAVAPGTANADTLMYGLECKYYSARPSCTDFEIDNAPGIYALGDGAGFTRSLSQAAANGLLVADLIRKRAEE